MLMSVPTGWLVLMAQFARPIRLNSCPAWTKGAVVPMQPRWPLSTAAGATCMRKQVSPVQYVDKQLGGGHASMLAVKLPSCVSVALPPGSQGAATEGLTPELQAAYVLL